jgi:TP901 family phage tail tape measure protein
MSSENEIEIILEADATQGVRSTEQLSTTVAGLFRQFQVLETTLKNVFNKELPQGIGKVKDLANRLREIEQINERLSRGNTLGGVAGVSRAGGYKGAISGLRDSPERLALSLEKEANAVAAARLQIYRRLKEAMPNASEQRLQRAYVSSLSQLGAAPPRTAGRDERGRFMTAAATETKAFNELMAKEELVISEAKYAKELSQYENMLRQKALALAKFEGEERAIQRDAYLKRVNQTAVGRNIRPEDRARLAAGYDSVIGDAEANYVPRPARVSAAKISDKERLDRSVASRVEARNAQFKYKGGAPTLLAEAHTLANYSLIGGAIGGAFEAGKAMVDLEVHMKRVQSVTGSTDGEMRKLNTTILNVGASSNKSLKDIAEAAEVLARAGNSASNVGKMLKNITTLATASGDSVHETALAVADIMKIYHLTADQTGALTASLTDLSVKGRVTLEDVGKAFKGAGEFAEGAGVQVNEFVAAQKAAAAGGIRDGTQFGSGFKNLIEQLEQPTKRFREVLAKVGLTAADVSVETNGLGGALENMHKAGLTSSEAMHGLSIRAYAVYNAMSQQLPLYEQAVKGQNDQAASAAAAAAQMDTLAASWQRFSNITTKVIIEASGPFVTVIRAMMGGAGELLNVLSNMNGPLAVLGTLLAGIVSASLLAWISKLTLGFLGLANGNALAAVSMAASAAAAGELAVAMEILSLALGPVGWLAVGLTAVIGLFGLFSAGQNSATRAIQESGEAIKKSSDAYTENVDKVKQLDEFVSMLVDRHAMLATNTAAAGSAAEQAMHRFGQWGLQLDANGKTVDGLINKLLDLRKQMSLQAREAARSQVVNLQTQNTQLGSANVVPTRAIIDKSRRGDVISPAVRAKIPKEVQARMDRGQLTEDDITIVKAAMGKGPSNVNTRLFVESLDAYSSNNSKIEINKGLIGNAQAEVGDQTVKGSSAYQAFSKDAVQKRAALRAKLSEAGKIQDPIAKLKAIHGVEEEAKQAVGILEGQAKGNATFLDNPELKNLRLTAGVGGEKYSAGDWKSRAAMLKAQAGLARGPEKKRLLDQASDARREAKAMDPNATDEELANMEAEDQAKTQKSMNSDARKAAAEAAKKKRAAEKAAKEAASRLKMSADDLSKFRENQSENTKGSALLSVANGGDLATAIKSIEDAAGAALAAKIVAIKDTFAKDHLGEAKSKALSAELLGKITVATDEAASKLVQSKIEAIGEAHKSRVYRAGVAYDETMAPLEQRSAVISSVGNLFNQGQLGGVHAYSYEREQKLIDIEAAKAKVVEASSRVSAGQDTLTTLQDLHSSGKGGEKTAAELRKASEDLKKYNKELEDAQANVVKLTNILPAYASAQEAVNGALNKYRQEAELSKPMYEGLADGLVGAMGKSQNAFQTFLQSTLTGQKSLKSGFKDMAISILASMEQLATELLARQIFKMLLSLALPGGDNTMSAPHLSLATGGMVPFKHFAAGGFNKDSVPAMLMPGEFVMSRTATDYIGKDNLQHMNMQGNRRMSGMPTVGQATKRAPDMVHVWVVAPESRPPMGKGQIIATITDDMLSNGQTKKLIKAIALGQA